MRYAARIDGNKKEIVSAMRAAGAYVWDLKLPTDCLVGVNNRTAIVEIKSSAKAKYTKLQEDFFRDWRGGTVARVDSVEAALRLIAVMKESP